MQHVTATFRNGRVELAEPVDWPEGLRVEVRPLVAPAQGRPRAKPPMTEWPAAFFDQLREQWGDEAFERPPQGETEVREDWYIEEHERVKLSRRDSLRVLELLENPPAPNAKLRKAARAMPGRS